MALPTLTPEQRAAALEKAAAARKARGELLAAVKSGHLSVVDVLARAETDWHAASGSPRSARPAEGP